MRWRLLQIAIVVASLIAGQVFIYAQQAANTLESDAPCSVSNSPDEKPNGPEITIAEVSFSGSLRMPVSDQQEIADSIQQQTRGSSLDRIVDEGLERARAGWQSVGYFKVEVSGEAKILTSNPISERIALNITVDEGSQYRLRGITFKNNRAFKNADFLRGLFPITDGDLFSREKIVAGLENVRKAYGELGYLNFTSVPDTEFDDENTLISLVINVDEGRQFRIGRVEVLGLAESAREQVLKTLPESGQVFSSRLWEESLLKHASMFPDCDCSNQVERKLDEKSGVVTLTLDFRPCSTN